MVAIAVLDDYQNVALRMADWSNLQKNHRVVVFNQRLNDVDSAARALADFDVVCVMRERMPVPRALFEKLPKLKLVVAHKTDFRGGKPTVSLDEYLALLDDIVGAYCGKCS